MHLSARTHTHTEFVQKKYSAAQDGTRGLNQWQLNLDAAAN